MRCITRFPDVQDVDDVFPTLFRLHRLPTFLFGAWCIQLRCPEVPASKQGVEREAKDSEHDSMAIMAQSYPFETFLQIFPVNRKVVSKFCRDATSFVSLLFLPTYGGEFTIARSITIIPVLHHSTKVLRLMPGLELCSSRGRPGQGLGSFPPFFH